MTPEKSVSKAKRNNIIAWMLMFFLGAVFLVAALSKLTDMGRFVSQIQAYGLITSRGTATVAAFLLVFLETALGVALVSSYQPRLSVCAAGFLLVVFLCATLYAAMNGVNDDCGCFGALLKRSPAEAAVEDFVLILMAAAAFFLYRSRDRRMLTWKLGASMAAGLAAMLAPLAMGFSYAPPMVKGKLLGPVRLADGTYAGLDKGLHLVALLDPGCRDCEFSVPVLNDIQRAGISRGKEMLYVVGLCAADEASILEFKQLTGAEFPIHSIAEDDFWRLLDQPPTPRFLLVSDGRVIASWQRVAPDPQQVKAVL